MGAVAPLAEGTPRLSSQKGQGAALGPYRTHAGGQEGQTRERDPEPVIRGQWDGGTHFPCSVQLAACAFCVGPALGSS